MPTPVWCPALLDALGLPLVDWLGGPAAFGVVLLLYLWKSTGYSVILLLAFISIAPFCYVLILRFIPSGGGVTFDYYYDVFLGSPQYLLRFWKSMGICLCIVAGQLAVSVLTGYGFAKCEFRGRDTLLFVLMIPMVAGDTCCPTGLHTALTPPVPFYVGTFKRAALETGHTEYDIAGCSGRFPVAAAAVVALANLVLLVSGSLG